MKKQTIELDIDVPDGWIIIDYRTPLKGEFYLNANHGMVKENRMENGKYKCAWSRFIVIREE